jgi:hypothetical protein
VEEWKAESEEKRAHELDKRLGVAHEGKVGCLIVEVDGNRAVRACRFGGLAPGSPSAVMLVGADKTS